MDFADSAAMQALRKTVSDIAGSFGGSYYAARAHSGRSCTELWEALGGAGFLGVNVPEEYGGGGGGLSELAAVCEETAAQGCPLLLVVVSSAVCGEVLARYGSTEQKQRWLPGIASGERKMVFAITEPDAGSNTHRLASTATRDGQDWVLRGTKYYISGADEAEAIMVVARTGRHEATGQARLSLLIVPAGAPGLTARPLPVDLMLPERQFTLHFDDVRLGRDALVGAEGEGFGQVFHGLNPERITGAAHGVGIARYALSRAADYARTRQVWDQPVGAHQGIAHPLAKAKIETELAGLMTRKAAWLHDHGRPAGEAANMAKYAAGEAAIAAVDQAIQVHGGNGVSAEFGLMPLWGMARLLRIAPVSREMILNHVAQHSLGLPKSYA
ncbi:MAG: acyl-CoA dehydrogenase family protein [Nocardiopsaceae bacterium]|jgi:alkylation response protein AidB-like acyl-CoA dehydrogenase|nr:acyl-CoA dehydrogenase family protein [Nocardiopsaceae bacterium]